MRRTSGGCLTIPCADSAGLDVVAYFGHGSTQALGAGFVDREAAQRRAASREEQLTCGHKAVAEGSGQTDTNTVGEDRRVYRLVIRILREELGETGA